MRKSFLAIIARVTRLSVVIGVSGLSVVPPSSAIDFTHLHSTKAASAKWAAANKETKKDEPAELIIYVNVPVNANAQDKFTVNPVPVEPPAVNAADCQLSTNTKELRELLKNAVYYKWGKPGVTPPDWRIDRALQQALRQSRKHLPQLSEDMDQWLEGLLPYFKGQVLLINTQESERAKKLSESGLSEAARQPFQDYAEKNGNYPVTVRVVATTPGIRQGKTHVKEGTWWITGTHSTPSMTYYWQEMRNISPPGARLVELNEQNALLIKGHY